MSSKHKHNNKQGPGNRSFAPAPPWVRRLAKRKKSIRPRAPPKDKPRQSLPRWKKQDYSSPALTSSGDLMPAGETAITNLNVANTSQATCPLSSPLTGLAGFETANHEHQRALALNLSESSRLYGLLRVAKHGYHAGVLNHPTRSAYRGHTLSEVKGLWEKYDALLGIRRGILENQQYRLEQAIQVDDIRDSPSLLLAIDSQIEATRDLSACQELCSLYFELPTNVI